jgi:drug/metabolite transporter (DMT)-like permease
MNKQKPKITQQIFADIALLVITAIWGSTFVMVDRAVEDIGVFTFNAFRFTLAFVALLIVFSYQLYKNKFTWKTLGRGVLIGVFLFVGYTFQTLGLAVGTEPGKAAFITGLYVVLVPIFASILLKKAPHKLSWLAIFIVVVGLGLLSIESLSMTANDILGDLLIVVGTFGYAFHIITIDKFVEKEHFSALAVIQTGTVAILSWITSGIFWNSNTKELTGKFAFNRNDFTNDVLLAIFFTGILATALILALQTYVQKRTTPTHVAVIFSTEPVFGAIFAIIFVGEVFLPRQWGGCVLIIGSMIFQQFIDIYLPRKKEPDSKSEISVEPNSTEDEVLEPDKLEN